MPCLHSTQLCSRDLVVSAMAAEIAMNNVFENIKPVEPGTSPSASVSDDQLLTLYFLFNKNLEKALHILDNEGVTKVQGEPSGRTVFQVVSESMNETEYLCFPEHFCSCPSFYFEVVSRAQHLCCKHQLAARLAISLKTFNTVTVSDEDLAILLFEM